MRMNAESLPKVAIVIRAYNEAEKVVQYCKVLLDQDYPKDKVEIVIVDNGSSDDTKKVAQKYGAKYIYLPQGQFNFPKSSNLGVAASSAPLVIITSAHALPQGLGWVKSIISHFDGPKVAGVFGPVIPYLPCSLAEWVFSYPLYYLSKMTGAIKIKSAQMGVMGATNCVIRKNLWERHPFDEAYGMGGEDFAWAKWALSDGYYFIFEPKFVVRHSHKLNSIDYFKQRKYWKSTINHPRPFNKKELNYRKDLG